ncbi:hypothetical protein SAMN02745121_04370 [Nannocystis exedens]|uniref:ADYC domain-containing protein n=1 Tax=Nannocystis exedens TaxID=54 RepID=A0A1I2AUM7_9BACT|nr:ADYC domain-containing protein [Nannocystis exedens]PCC74267.1 hypothetical protein NAEX_07356 [Nannocystis exedens]SFE47278.1 hypothetical protein SAMN02745121_04370 [Nannocystis exedens]
MPSFDRTSSLAHLTDFTARLSALAVGLGLAVACDRDDLVSANGADAVEFRTCLPGSCQPGCICPGNGSILTMGSYSAIDLNGQFFENAILQGMTLEGSAVTNFSAPAGMPQGTHQGVLKSGEDLIGMKFFITEGERRRTFQLVFVDEDDSELPAHRVMFNEIDVGPMCWTEEGEADWVSLIEDVWWDPSGARNERPNTLTFACNRGAIAKAIHAWTYNVYHDAIVPYHQAAVRMIRADYCGDGEAFTEAGTMISWSDTLFHPDNGFGPIEAVWDEHGAVCLNTPRLVPRADVEAHCGPIPTCAGVDELADIDALGGLVLSRAP